MELVPSLIAERFRSALEALLVAFNYAEDSQTDRWQFAVDLNGLQAIGATLNDLRWLLLRGLAEHARETTIPGDSERSFRKLPSTAFPRETHFVLSIAGAQALRQMLVGTANKEADVARIPAKAKVASQLLAQEEPRITPKWDSARRELQYGSKVIKRYRVPAPNQALVLAAFEESGWPEFIDDPLPPVADQDPKERLQATIKSLNRNQFARIIRFHGNGDGQQVYWQAVVGALKQRIKRRPRRIQSL